MIISSSYFTNETFFFYVCKNENMLLALNGLYRTFNAHYMHKTLECVYINLVNAIALKVRRQSTKSTEHFILHKNKNDDINSKKKKAFFKCLILHSPERNGNIKHLFEVRFRAVFIIFRNIKRCILGRDLLFMTTTQY